MVIKRELLQETILSFELSVQVYNPTPHSQTGLEFLGMKRLGQIIIGSSGQAAYNFIHLRHSGQQDDVSVRGSRILADALTKLNSGDVGHHPIRNEQRGLMRAEKIDRFAAVFREHDAVLFGRLRSAGDR